MEDHLDFEIDADELDLFVQDVNEHLQTLEAGVLGMETRADPKTLNATFRAAHTLKAIAGVAGHQPMAEITHAMENLLDGMREARLMPSQILADELLNGIDVLRSLRDEVITRESTALDVPAVVKRLRALLPAGSEHDGTPIPAPRQALIAQEIDQIQATIRQGAPILEITAHADEAGFVPAARLMQVAVAMSERGQVLAQRPSQDELLANENACHIWLLLATDSAVDVLNACMDEISELTEWHVQPWKVPLAPGSQSQRRGSDLSEVVNGFVGEIIELAEAVQPDGIEIKQDEPLLVGRGGETEHESAPKEEPGRPPSGSDNGRLRDQGDKTIRISIERLDILMDLVGEMVTDRTRLERIHETLRGRFGKNEDVRSLDETVNHLGQIIDQLQYEVMRARMLPLARLFDRFPRLVRDVARSGGKEVELIIVGETTELDRSIIEAIGDPMIHLLRNAVDHGIEHPQEREAAGKQRVGTLQVSAEHVEGQIAITVTDDGKGIDPDLIRRAAVERGLITEEEAVRLRDDEAITLIFRPGLSTADEVTGLSGRGVGLDIVGTNVGRLGGSVSVESEPGWGTTFRVTLPLTLATVETMLVSLGKAVYAIPLTSIVESLYLSDVKVSSVRGTPAIQWRERVLPILDLGGFFGQGMVNVSQLGTSRAARRAVVVVNWGRLQAGLMVDRIIAKQEVVAKPLGSIIGNVPGLSGCTILGDGSIALIVDVPGLINVTTQTRINQRQQMKDVT